MVSFWQFLLMLQCLLPSSPACSLPTLSPLCAVFEYLAAKHLERQRKEEAESRERQQTTSIGDHVMFVSVYGRYVGVITS